MKKIVFAAMAASLALMASCATSLSSPRTAGNFAGRAAYVTYARVADKQTEEVRKKVEELWKEINRVNDVSDLRLVRTLVGERFDAVIADARLTPAEQAMLISIKEEILAKVDEVLNGRLQSNSDGLQFLVGVRDGVNAMINLSTPKQQ